jgi:hypothetical protein
VNYGPYQFQKTIKHGMTVSDISSVSSELGVSAYGLSGKLSTTFSHTISIMNETDVQHTFNVLASHTGIKQVWTLWQLIEQFVFVDRNGDVVVHRSYAEYDDSQLKIGSSIFIPVTTAVHAPVKFNADLTCFDAKTGNLVDCP